LGTFGEEAAKDGELLAVALLSPLVTMGMSKEEAEDKGRESISGGAAQFLIDQSC
jgi:hypothetical protein